MEHIVACGTQDAHTGMKKKESGVVSSPAAFTLADKDPAMNLLKTAYSHADPARPEDAIKWHGIREDLTNNAREEIMIRIIQQQDPPDSGGIAQLFSEDDAVQQKEVGLWQTQLFVGVTEYLTGQKLHINDYTRRVTDGSLVLQTAKLTTFPDKWELWVQGHPLGDECAYKAFWDGTGYLRRIIWQISQNEDQYLHLSKKSATRVDDVLRTALLLLEALCLSCPAGQYDRIETKALQKAGLRSRADFQPDSWLSRMASRVRSVLGQTFQNEMYPGAVGRIANIFSFNRPDLMPARSPEAFRALERQFEMEDKCAGQARLELFSIENAMCQPWIARMKKRGYCPSHFDRLHIIGGFSLVELACVVDNSPAVRDEDHSECSLHGCALETVDTSNYTIRHKSTNCECESLKPVLADVKRCLDEGSFPLIDCYALLDGSDKVVQKWQPGMRFTAISHVWADGLGSTSEVGLPRCQIDYIGHLAWLNMFQMFDPDSEEPLGDDVKLTRLVWMDSLCVPSDMEYRKTAVSRMLTTYTEAYVTLVLDSGLKSLDPSVAWEAPNMQLIRILTSKWMSRMWTFLEAFSASKLSIQFGDQHWTSINLIVQNFMRLRAPATPTNQALLSHFCAYGALGPFNKDETPSFAQLARHLRSRRTSKAGDEALIIAELMKLDIGRLLAVDDVVSRNCELCNLIKESIPRGIIFDESPRLKSTGTGYGWCPASFLHNQFGQAAKGAGGGNAIFVGFGLLGKYWILRLSSRIRISTEVQTEVEWIADNGMRITVAVTTSKSDFEPFEMDAIVFLEPPSILTDPIKAVAAANYDSIAVQEGGGLSDLPAEITQKIYQQVGFVYILSPELWQTPAIAKEKQKVNATAGMERAIFT